MPRQPPSIANPQLVVAIDFGTTGTAVSWALTSKPRRVHSIKTWPRVQGTNQATKVPQAIARIDNGIWGFDALDALDAITNGVNEPETAGQYLKNCFIVPLSDPEKTRTYLSRYLNYLYSHIRDTIDPQLVGEWDSTYIWTVFNEPNGWMPEVIECFEEAISETNFRLDDLRAIRFVRANPSLLAMARVYGENRRLKTLERAFANTTRWLGSMSAVLVDNGIRWLETDQEILVAEIGVTRPLRDVRCYSACETNNIIRHLTIQTTRIDGSDRIDEQVQRTVVGDILQTINCSAAIDANSDATDARVKCNHAQAVANRLVTLEAYITEKHAFRGVNGNTTQFEITDTNGQTVTFTKNITEPLEQAFSGLCDQVWRDIERHLQADRQPRHDRPRTIVLTGGLSNNGFVQRRLQERAETLWPPTDIFLPPEPELSVSKGLVWYALDKIRGKRRFWLATV
ncbi:hsp70 family chaperone [Colletotrichum musicola]|uniref:Hsp70 family chaperone n=1 Tax=Colletotrichum musicola TaxID=2175873 RepID=A0A8H6MTX6_9PEZI|nr:hsp70 family chaperone [Colletotrichum musicola]